MFKHGNVGQAIYMAMTRSTIILSALMAFLLFASGPAWAQAKETRPAAKAITGPDAVDNQLDDDQEEKPNLLDTNLLKSWEDWKADIADRSSEFCRKQDRHVRKDARQTRT